MAPPRHVDATPSVLVSEARLGERAERGCAALLVGLTRASCAVLAPRAQLAAAGVTLTDEEGEPHAVQDLWRAKSTLDQRRVPRGGVRPRTPSCALA